MRLNLTAPLSGPVLSRIRRTGPLAAWLSPGADGPAPEAGAGPSTSSL